jgi:hypothetical protein
MTPKRPVGSVAAKSASALVKIAKRKTLMKKISSS